MFLLQCSVCTSVLFDTVESQKVQVRKKFTKVCKTVWPSGTEICKQFKARKSRHTVPSYNTYIKTSIFFTYVCRHTVHVFTYSKL